MFKTMGLYLTYGILFLGLYGCSCSEKPSSQTIEPGLYITDITVNEEDSGTIDYEIAVNLQRENQDAVSVSYKVEALSVSVNAIATASKDFTEKTGTLNFEAGSAETKTISFSVINDKLYEHSEDFMVTLTAASGAKIVTGQAKVTIKDNDPKPVVSFSVDSALASTTFAENEAERVQLKLKLDVVSGVDASMMIRKSTESSIDSVNANFGKVAANRIDYLLKSAGGELLSQAERMIIPEGQTELVINLDVIDDGMVENTENFTLTLIDPVDVTVISTSNSLNFSITDNDQFDTTKVLVQPLNDTGLIYGTVAVSGADLPNIADLTNDQITEQVGQLEDELANELDKAFGRDSQALASTLVKKGSGMAGFDYTRLDSAGNETNAVTYGSAGETHPWDCVKDNNTNLVWEVKAKGNLGLRAESRAFYWYDPNFTTNGGDAGELGDFQCAESGSSECNTAYYVADINAMKLCGLTGWRLPTLSELRSIINYNAVANKAMAYDTDYFAGDSRGVNFIWSSTISASAPEKVWTIRFGPEAFAEEARPKNSSASSGIRLVNDSLLKQAQQ